MHVKAEPLPSSGWPRTQEGAGNQIAGLDENADGPWPSRVRLACSREGGGAILVGEADIWRKPSSSLHHQVGLMIHVPGEAQLVWITFPNQLARTRDQELAWIRGAASISGRMGDRPGQARALNAQLRSLLDASGLPRSSRAEIELCSISVPGGDVGPSPSVALDRAIHLALLKLPILGRGRNVAEGAPLYVPDLEGPPPPREAQPVPTPKRAAIFMLPGGVREYQRTLDVILEELAESPMTIEALNKLLADRFQTPSESAQASYRSFLAATGLVELEGGLFRLTEPGSDYLVERDPVHLFEHLDARFTGLLDTLVIAEKVGPTSVEKTADKLRYLLGTTWKTTMQPMIRRNWLLSLGLVSREPDGDVPTEVGTSVLANHADKVAEIVQKLDAAPPPEPEPVIDHDAAVYVDRVDLTPELVHPHLGKPSGRGRRTLLGDEQPNPS